MRPLRRCGAALALALATSLATGCFVLDELDAGSDLLDQHAGRTPGEAEPEAGEAEEGSPGLVARVKDWWAGLGEESGTGAAPDSGPPPHPDDVLGTCDLGGGGLTFMRRFDCQRKGGRFTPRRASGS